MADLKISQLTGATTPLAGSEVLPVVQSGATKKVSVANLTSGRTVSASGLDVLTGKSSSSVTNDVKIQRSSSASSILQAPNIYFEDTTVPQYTVVIQAAVGNFEIWSYGTGSWVKKLTVDGAGNTLPGTDNTQVLGFTNNRWSTVYAGTGTINTSDAREKTSVSKMTPLEIKAASQLAKEIGTFSFLDAVATKNDAARTHIGMTVQKAIEILQSNGLDPMKYAFICYDKWDDEFQDLPAVDAKEAVFDEDNNVIEPAIEARPAMRIQTQTAGDHYGFRTDQLLMFIARGFEERLSALESIGS